jgi:hypothetical protein
MKHKRDFHFKIYLDINSIISGEGRKGEGKGAGGGNDPNNVCTCE